MMISEAKSVVTQVVNAMPVYVEFAVRTYGEDVVLKRGDNEPISTYEERSESNLSAGARPSQLVAPFGTGANRILDAVHFLHPAGQRRLEYAIQCATLQDCAGAGGGTIILLVTGGADSCGGSPSKFVAGLAANSRIPIVIVNVNPGASTNAIGELKRVAEKSGGFYYDDGADLIDDVRVKPL
jgi:hypothetical protein